MLQPGELFLEEEQTTGPCLGASERKHAQTIPTRVFETLDQALGLVATVLNHAELFGALASLAMAPKQRLNVLPADRPTRRDGKRDDQSLRRLRAGHGPRTRRGLEEPVDDPC